MDLRIEPWTIPSTVHNVRSRLDSIDEFEVNTRSEKMIYTMDGEEVHMIPMLLDYCYNRVVLPLRNSDEGKYSTVCLSPAQ